MLAFSLWHWLALPLVGCVPIVGVTAMPWAVGPLFAYYVAIAMAAGGLR